MLGRLANPAAELCAKKNADTGVIILSVELPFPNLIRQQHAELRRQFANTRMQVYFKALGKLVRLCTL